MAKLTLASVDALRTRFADDAACDAALAAFADTAALRAPLRELVEAQHRYLQAEFEVAQVADVLRRDQKYAPVGRPSINIVQLRKQQAATKQAALIARQVVAQAAQTFVRVSGLAVKAKQSPSEACVARVALSDRATKVRTHRCPHPWLAPAGVPAAGRQPSASARSAPKEGPLFSGPSAFSRRVSGVHQAAGFSPVASVVMRIFTSSLTFGA
jgi:hypothetical protein